jgi:ferredoxin-NADP reductase
VVRIEAASRTEWMLPVENSPTIAPTVTPARGLHRLRVARVVVETAEARSFVLETPAGARDRFAYRAGQFLTFRVPIGGREYYRSYSMSSAPALGEALQVTVKRVPGGAVSNWLNDTLSAGDVIEATPPAGVFVLRDCDDALVVFAAGSGITPVFSLVKTVLATTRRPVRLLYANRDRASTIFAAPLTELVGRHPGRLRVSWHYDDERGFVDRAAVRAALDGTAGEFFVCGPDGFMDVVAEVLAAEGVAPDLVHVERFTPAAQPDERADAEGSAAELIVQCGRRRVAGEHRAGATILQTARALGLAPPSSCEAGSCATCIARVTEGSVRMRHNEALTPEEVAEGWVLTCQAFPTSPLVRVVYE